MLQKPKNWKKNASLKTLIINVKKWRDKTNGNTYFTAQVVVNFAFSNQFEFDVPFSYGYGKQYLYDVERLLREAGIIGQERIEESNVKIIDIVNYVNRKKDL